jgi:sulfur relay (sulfurtransferase) complex TusBCD TusD component (DsrE family)
MGNLLIILSDTPFQSERVEHVLNIAEAALEKEHQVSIFLFMDGVYNMMRTQNGDIFKMEPVSERLRALMEKGVEVKSCKLCKVLRGLDESVALDGVSVSGVSFLNEAITEADSVISIIG